MIIRLDDRNAALVTGLQQIQITDTNSFLRALRHDHTELIVQAIDAEHVAGLTHVQLVLAQAWEAWRRGVSFARQRELDLLVRFSLERQIGRAVLHCGIKPGIRNLVVMAVGRHRAVVQCERSLRQAYPVDERVLLADPRRLERLRRRHKIMKQALGAAPVSSDALACVLAERSALLASEQV